MIFQVMTEGKESKHTFCYVCRNEFDVSIHCGP